MRRLLILSLVSYLAVTVTAFAQGAYKIGAGSGLPAGDVSQAVKDSLQPDGSRLLSSAGKELCEVWLRKQLPAAENSDAAANVLYGKVAPGSLIGVIHFADPAKDYRGQDIKAGYYTLRYELIPEDGNHMGVSQYRDFLLLVPAADDPDGSKPLTFKETVSLSRKAANTGHPGVMLLDAISDSDKTFPSVFQDYSQNWALQVKSQIETGGKAQDYPLAIVLVGQYQG
ncbi:MAG TPA: hypothetical protein VMV34_10060 [Terriglobia bacterium]|nr:hypothetical protein [Terriglobia bacterium]